MLFRHNKLNLTFLSIFFVISLMAVTAKDNPLRETLNFNTDWAFHLGDIQKAFLSKFDDSSWEKVSIPHTMRVEGKHDGGGAVYQGVGWYRRYFKLPEQYKNKRITINFEGVQMNCEVYINGEKIKTHFGGYNGFIVDISKHVKFESDNLLAVKVINVDDPETPPGKPLKELDFNYYGGIYRNVQLLITDNLYISDPLEADIVAGGGVFVSFADVSKEQSVVNIQTHLVNSTSKALSTKLITTIYDKHDKVVGSSISEKGISEKTDAVFQQQVTIENANLWHPDNPYLYRLCSQVYESDRLIDEKNTQIGIRSIGFKSSTGKSDGFYLNGEKLYLRGANRHQSYQYVGDAASNSMQYRDALQLKKGGFNAVRAAHYPASPAFLDACDQLGLLVIQCQPGWQFFNADSVFVERSFRDTREMIRRDRNRPSVFLWETSLNESPTPKDWMEKAVSIAHEEMPGGQMYTADDLNDRSEGVYDVFYKVINRDGTDPYPNKPSLTREWGDTWYADASKEDGLRSSRMYTAKGMINQSIMRQNALNGSPDEKDGGYWDHAGLDSNPRIGGYFLWSFNDYTRGSDPITAFSGVVDKDRYPKFGYYQLKSMQDASNSVYEPMVFIASYNNNESIDSSIVVFSNCDKVKLYRNQKLVGELDSKTNANTAPYIYNKNGSPLYKFDLDNYESGELKAEGLLNNKVVCSHTVNTPGQPHHLEIEVADFGVSLVADDSDMLPIYIKVCDENGEVVSNTKGLEQYPIDLDVTGEAWLIGGNSQRSEMNPIYTEGGIAYALIRATKKPGKIMIKAASQGLVSAERKVHSISYDGAFVMDGVHHNWINEYEKQDSLNLEYSTSKQVSIENKIDLANKADISLQSNGDYDKMFDEDFSTVWIAAKDDSLPIVLHIDLKEKYQLEHYQIFWGKDSDWYTHSIEVSSDNKNWEYVKNEAVSSGQDYSFNELRVNKKTRYLKLTLLGVRPENSRIAIREFQLFGSVSK